MSRELKVTIASNLAMHDIQSCATFKNTSVLDIRQCATGEARPIEEAVLRKLNALFVKYEQFPLGLDQAGKDLSSLIHRQIAMLGGDVLVLTESVSQLASICCKLAIPFQLGEIPAVEASVPESFIASQTMDQTMRLTENIAENPVFA